MFFVCVSLPQPTEYNYMDAFEIDEVTGVIRIAKPLNREQPLDREQVEVIRMSLLCEDLEASTGKQTATTTLTIIVEDTNDNNPQFRKPYYRRSVAENSKNGTTVVSVVADDIDKNRTITYALQVVNKFFMYTFFLYLMHCPPHKCIRSGYSEVSPVFSFSPLLLYPINLLPKFIHCWLIFKVVFP